MHKKWALGKRLLAKRLPRYACADVLPAVFSLRPLLMHTVFFTLHTDFLLCKMDLPPHFLIACTGLFRLRLFSFVCLLEAYAYFSCTLASYLPCRRVRSTASMIESGVLAPAVRATVPRAKNSSGISDSLSIRAT